MKITPVGGLGGAPPPPPPPPNWPDPIGKPCQGVIQAKAEVGYQVWDSLVWDPKLPQSKTKNTNMIKINKRATSIWKKQ